MMKAILYLVVVSLLCQATPGLCLELTATGHDSRIDLQWQAEHNEHHIYRSDSPTGPSERLTDEPWKLPVYSDFLGENSRTYYYRITTVDSQGVESAPSSAVTAQSVGMTDAQLLTSVQQATLRYFWDYYRIS